MGHSYAVLDCVLLDTDYPYFVLERKVDHCCLFLLQKKGIKVFEFCRDEVLW